MSTLTWNGGTQRFNNPNAWSPAETPAPGDTLYIGTGTAVTQWNALSGLTIHLQDQFKDSYLLPTATPPTLSLEHTVIAATTIIELGGPFYSGNNTTATIDAHGYNLNLGIITNSALESVAGPYGIATTLTIDVGGKHGLFVNSGTLSVTPQVVAPSTMIVQATSHGATLLNQGVIESDGILKLEINAIGHGEIAFGAVFSRGHDGPPGGPTIEADGTVGGGQTVDFGTGVNGPYNTGTDSHGQLILDDAAKFRGVITDFVASTNNVGGNLHPDEILLQGADITSFCYHGDAQSGVLTLREGCETVARLRFAGSYSTDSFQITHTTTGNSVIELKPT